MDWEAVDERLDAHAERGRLRTALNVLADSDRELLLLVAWEGLTPAEAAVALGISPVAARTRLHRARRRARNALERTPCLDAIAQPASRLLTTLHAQEPAS